nr:hypothetical protein [Tanacetum cinerariifolium]
MFRQGEDPIECINKATAFLSVVASRFPPSDNQLITSSNLINQATIQAGQPRVAKCYKCQGEGHMVRQCTQPKRPRNAAWFKEKLMLVEAHEASQILDEEQLSFLVDPDVQEMKYSEQTHVDNFQDNEIHSGINIIMYSQYLEESQDAIIQDTNPFTPTDLLVLPLVEQMTDHIALLDKKNQTNKMRIQPTLYDASVIAKEHAVIFMIDDEETLILEEESRSNMLDKQNDPISIDKKIKISTIEYSKLNKIKEDLLRIDNDQLLNQITSQEIVHIVANSMDIFYLKKSCGMIASQEKDTVIRKLKERIKSLSGKDSMENVKKDIDEIETINIELEHSVAKLLSENENLRKEREHLKSIYKDQFDLIRKTRVQSKEHCDSLIAQINAKSVENSNLNAQLQEKLDIEPISPRLKKNRDAHEVYIEKTIEYTDTLCGLVERVRTHEDLGKLNAKADIVIFVVYALAKKAFRIYNRRTQKIMETIHLLYQKAVEIADSPVSTFIEQYAPSSSIPSTQEHEHSLIISQGVEESLKMPLFYDDPLYEFLHEDSTSQGSSSNVRPSHTRFELIGRWTKDHLIKNVIGDPSRSVSTRKQLKIDAMWCYFDAFLTSVEPKNFKQAMTKPSWIDAMQEEIHEFERL